MNTHLHTPAALWPVWRQPAEQTLRAMLGELEGLAITGGESSVRVSPKGIQGGRWLAGFSPVGVSKTRLMGLPERLGMPVEDAHHFRSQWPKARQIGLAVEQTDTQVVAKVYLEFPLPSFERRTSGAAQRHVALQITSSKWRVDVPACASRHTEYWRVSGLDGAAMVQLLTDVEDLTPAARVPYQAAAHVLAYARQTVPHWHDPRLLVVREPGTSRRGVGVRFYGSELLASDSCCSCGM